ncbi:DNA-directed RNA polymerase subunit B [Candidatus Woesearchaeota archaeon]|nr:DNA-directed RNA polymerase subunit B [Candidatus Woesearchaeota archaeon]
MSDVFLDNKYVGTVENPLDFVKNVKDKRIGDKVLEGINLIYDPKINEVHIETSKGRLRRPLIRVENGKSFFTKEHVDKLNQGSLSWDDLLKEGVIEYLDALEEEESLIALSEQDLTSKHTHLEISPVVILGLTTSLIPYSNFGSSSRLIRGSKIQKQSVGLYATNFLMRMDTDVSVLHNPEKPIVKSFMHDVLDYDKHPAGQNVTIALMSFEGYNMEDSIILNRGSVQRGLVRSTYFRPYDAEELRYSGGLTDEIHVPDKEVKGYKSEKDYKHLEKDGIVYAGAKVKEDEVVIGRTSPPRFLGEMEEFSIAASTRRESSVTVREGEGGVVDMVVITENEEGNKVVQIRLRHQRIPEIGDKFASRHGQKGVVGMVIDEENMPFSASGITPDIIFSPHSIPGRMTISHLIEVVAGKVGSLAGRYIDGTTFDVEKESDLRKELVQLGFRENGTEVFYNGMTGEKFKARIFVGNMYYLRLKHMVANKLHARASGRIQLLTRQPIEGRARGGGLRVGEMEKDCFVAHGASLLLKERFDSDKTIVYVCEKCGMLAVNDTFKDIKQCLKCGSNVEITAIELSYAFKLLMDELKSLCIYPKLLLRSKY